MKTIVTIATIAAFATLAACNQVESPAEVTTAEAVETEAANDAVTVTEVVIPNDEQSEDTTDSTSK